MLRRRDSARHGRAARASATASHASHGVRTSARTGRSPAGSSSSPGVRARWTRRVVERVGPTTSDPAGASHGPAARRPPRALRRGLTTCTAGGKRELGPLGELALGEPGRVPAHQRLRRDGAASPTSEHDRRRRMPAGPAPRRQSSGAAPPRATSRRAPVRRPRRAAAPRRTRPVRPARRRGSRPRAPAVRNGRRARRRPRRRRAPGPREGPAELLGGAVASRHRTERSAAPPHSGQTPVGREAPAPPAGRGPPPDAPTASGPAQAGQRAGARQVAQGRAGR